MTTSSPGLDTGTGYGRPAPSHDARLTEIGPGTPMEGVFTVGTTKTEPRPVAAAGS
jgi:hypothetical protein